MAEADSPAPDPGDGMEFQRAAAPVAPSASFDAMLAAARRRLLGWGCVETVVGTVTGLSAGLALALAIVGAAPFSLALRTALLALIAAGGLLGLALVAKARLWPLRHDLVIGARLEDALRRRGLAIGDAVRGAVELRQAERDPSLGRSRALCEAHVAATAARVQQGGGLASLPAVALEQAVPTLTAAAAVAFVLLTWGLGASASFLERFDKLFSDAAVERALEARAATLLPLVTDLSLTLRFPAYMKEPDEVIHGSSGDVTAPRGTEVIIEGRADRTLESAALLLGEEERAAEVVDGRTVRARFVVNASTSYRFRLNGTSGGEKLDPVAHKVTVHVDAAPTVTLSEPSEDQVVKLDTTVKLAFSAKDDVGVTKFVVVVKRQGSARDAFRKDVLEVPGGLREAGGTGDFTIEETGARPGDKLSVFVEAHDNDIVSGPNVGRSQTRVLTVYSAAEQHRTVIARLEDVLSRMIDSLADELEAPVKGAPDAGALAARHQQIGMRHEGLTKALDEALLALADDQMAPLSVRRALANMKTKMDEAVDGKSASLRLVAMALPRQGGSSRAALGRLEGAQRVLVRRLEQDALYLEDLLNKERLAEARQIAEDLKRAQQDLKALVEQYKQSGDEETRKALLDEIQRMRAQMSELMERLAKLQRDMPDEFLNEEAFKGEQMLSDAADIDKLIEEGKLDEAAKALDDMLESTQKLVDELDSDAADYGGDEYEELRGKMERFSSELEALEKGQGEVVERNQALMDKLAKEAEAKLKGKLDKALAEVKKRVERAEESLEKLDDDSLFLNENEDSAYARARIDDLRRALESRDLEDATSAAEEAEAAARSAERSVSERASGRFGQRDRETLDQKNALEVASKELQAARKALQELLPDPSGMLDKAQKQRLSKDADRQQQLGEGAARLEALMEEIGEEAPVFGPEHQKRVQEARDAMQRATREMRNQNLRGARSAQRQARRQLSELARDLEQMGQGQKGPGGIPLPLPRGGSPGAERDGQEGNGSRSASEDVKIPDGSQFKVPDAYRKDILDAMREDVPDSWAGEVKRYYEKLIQ